MECQDNVEWKWEGDKAWLSFLLKLIWPCGVNIKDSKKRSGYCWPKRSSNEDKLAPCVWWYYLGYNELM